VTLKVFGNGTVVSRGSPKKPAAAARFGVDDALNSRGSCARWVKGPSTYCPVGRLSRLNGWRRTAQGGPERLMLLRAVKPAPATRE
jgi:hypothetical protein